MPVKYNIIQRGNPRDLSAPKKYYAVTQSVDEVTLEDLSKQIADISTVSSIDTLAVLESLLHVMPDHLLNGSLVRLGKSGTFRLTLDSEGTDTEAEFNSSKIKKVNLRFRPGKQISDALKTADYQKI